MSLPIALLPDAAADINLMAQQAAEYSAAARINLLVAIANKMRLIEQHPQMYQPITPQSALRRCVVMPTVSLYYRVQPTVIEIVGVIDSRRNPDAVISR